MASSLIQDSEESVVPASAAAAVVDDDTTEQRPTRPSRRSRRRSMLCSPKRRPTCTRRKGRGSNAPMVPCGRSRCRIIGSVHHVVVAALISSLSYLLLLAGRPVDATGIAPSLPEVMPAVAAPQHRQGQQQRDDDDDDERPRVSHHHLPLSGRRTGPPPPLQRGNETRNDGGGDEAPPVEDEDEDEEWRKSLPPQLQGRRGTLHRLLVPTSSSSGGKAIHDIHNGGNINNNDDGGNDDDDVCEIYLLGTSHVSKDSCVDARLLMEHVKPDVLFVELCSQRLGLLAEPATAPAPGGNGGEAAAESNGNDGEAAELNGHDANQPSNQPGGGGRGGNNRGGMSRTSAWSASLLTRIQADYATKLGVTIGGEFRESYRVAVSQQRRYEEEEMNRRRGYYNWEAAGMGVAGTAGAGVQAPAPAGIGNDNDDDVPHPCTVILGDRPVRLTLLRAWESLRLLGKIKLIVGLLWSSLRQPSETELKEWMDSILNDENCDLLSKSIEELSLHFPTIGETIINERDKFMVGKLRQTVGLLGNIPQSGRPRRRRIVAVVGAGHCPGMCLLFREGGGEGGDGSSLEDMLRSLVETKRYKAETDNEIRSLTTDVTELQAQ